MGRALALKQILNKLQERELDSSGSGLSSEHGNSFTGFMKYGEFVRPAVWLSACRGPFCTEVFGFEINVVGKGLT
jgi:hypothetical protein